MYDVAIIGGGPAGISAAIQASRYKLNSITIAPELGGKVKSAHTIENWPGDYSISGEDLTSKFINHIKQMNLNVVDDCVQNIKNIGDCFVISTQNGEVKAKKIIFAVGNEQNKLNIDGEKEFAKKGVSYKANKDGKLYKDKTVAVVGSGDSACTSAIFLADIAKKVYLMYRSKNLKAEPIWVDKAENNPKIELLAGVMPVKIFGHEKVDGLICDNGNSLNIDGIFVEIGFSPPKNLVEGLGLNTDEDGFVIVDSNQKTNIDNIWAAGDITTNSGKLRQMITAASEGMVALNSVYTDINNIS